MESIVLLGLEIENFKSFKELQSIEFASTAGFKFLGGSNELEPRLGANGAGKTSLWDAVCWCLYGASIRGQKSAAVLSWGASAKARPYVKLRLAFDGAEVAITREGSPDTITVDSTPTDQAGIDILMGMTRKRFLHAVIFGQGVPFFIDLPVPERGALLDEVLDLSIWLKAGAEATKRATIMQASIAEMQRLIAFYDGQLAALPALAELEADAAGWESDKAARFAEALVEVEAVEAKVADLVVAVSDLKQKRDAVDSSEIKVLSEAIAARKRRIEELTVDYRLMSEKAKAAAANIEDLTDHPNCPTCKQKYPAAERAESLRRAKESLAQLKRDIQVNGGAGNTIRATLDQYEADYLKLTRKRDFFDQQYHEAQRAQSGLEGTLNELVKRAEGIMLDTINPYAKRIAETRAQAHEATANRSDANNRRLEDEGKLQAATYWASAFKRVRLFLVKRVLTHLEIEVGNAAEILGLSGWRIEFLTEVETKSGTFKQGVQVRIVSPDGAAGAWESWSGGEGQRIRLAVALGFASMVQRMGGVDYGFEVWDEPSAWLSAEGIEDLMNCLRYRADEAKKSVWLLDHRALIHSGFDEIWQATKDGQGSRIELSRKLT